MPHEWNCDHCDFLAVAASRNELIKQIKTHLLGEGGNVLLRESPGDRDDHTACINHLSSYGAENTGVLCVTKSPAAKVEAWRREVGNWPEEFRILTPNTDVSLPSREVATAADFIDGPLTVTEIEPQALDSLAQDINEALNELTDAHEHVTVCMGPLTELINSFGAKQVFQIGHVLSVRLRNAGAFAHWHYMPATQMEASNHIITQLFQLSHDTRDGKNTIQQL